jgi:hypothetical protein
MDATDLVSQAHVTVIALTWSFIIISTFGIRHFDRSLRSWSNDYEYEQKQE